MFQGEAGNKVIISDPMFLYALNFFEPRHNKVQSIIPWSFKHTHPERGKEEGKENKNH